MDNYQAEFSHSIFNEEQCWLEKRRRSANLADDTHNSSVGLALSGGGIRSATFNLGALQALENSKQLKKIDYLSSVSGGSYIASALTWFKANCPERFPFGTKRADHRQMGGQVISWIRSHSSFLTPGNGINSTSLMSALLTGTFINLLIIMPLFMLILLLLSQPFTLTPDYSFESSFDALFVLAKGAILCAFATMILTALSTSIATARRGKLTERLRGLVSFFITISITCFVLGSIPLIHDWVDKTTDLLIHASISLSIIGVAVSTISAIKSNQFKTLIVNIVIMAGLLSACFGFIMVSYHAVSQWTNVPYYFYGALGLSLLLAVGCNINLVSMHGYYRNRLRDAFMPHKLPHDGNHDELDISTWHFSQNFYLKDIPISDAPYHIVNCNVELMGSKQSKYRNRGGDCFTFTPLVSGSSATGYLSTKKYVSGLSDLASVTAISGAAVATNTIATRSKPVNFLMGMLNIRLGCWLKNPSAENQTRVNQPLWYKAMLKDIFGQALSENKRYVHLSDGGHFENLGVYELVRRKSKLIFSFDIGADPDYLFQDLGKLTELIRVDFGAKLSIDVAPIIPNEKGESLASWVIGSINYQDGTTATFVYVKASMSDVENLSEDICSYKRQHPDFPHQSTANQFFTEAQFEAYRELGFQTIHRMLKTDDDVRQLFDAIK